MREPLVLPRLLPRLIGHRGAAALAPENTLAGFRKAAALGVRMVECDAKLTGDGAPILMHDDTLDRTIDGTGPVRDAALAAIRRLDAGAWFAPAFAGEPVPTLEQALAEAVALGLALNIEIKPCPGRERETAAAVLAAALARWPAALPPPLISSFAVESLAVARAVAPDWPRGYLIWDRPPDWRAIVAAVAPAAIHINAEHEDAARLAEYQATGLPVVAYTVNDPAAARALFAQGVAAVFTDSPNVIQAALADG